ncbi:hypothetical protein U369_14355 [Bacillus anthracis 52-G]|nr:hypothetical protein U368_14190 [Bacillus anthracis 8903-G]EVT98596.1 hypothetical protein U365_11560 [Bacillus anthracis 9080-G]EVU06420.1 hypothetical protein U369_14355 [Bacillus anthracis 52-G]EXJ20257.1 hypothetical protein Y693_14065 [Bacillus anthracis str. 95014]
MTNSILVEHRLLIGDVFLLIYVSSNSKYITLKARWKSVLQISQVVV